MHIGTSHQDCYENKILKKRKLSSTLADTTNLEMFDAMRFGMGNVDGKEEESRKTVSNDIHCLQSWLNLV